MPTESGIESDVYKMGGHLYYPNNQDESISMYSAIKTASPLLPPSHSQSLRIDY